jgi:hypothetical protein
MISGNGVNARAFTAPFMSKGDRVGGWLHSSQRGTNWFENSRQPGLASSAEPLPNSQDTHTDLALGATFHVDECCRVGLDVAQFR